MNKRKLRTLGLKLVAPVFVTLSLLLPFSLNLWFAGGIELQALRDNANRIRFTVWQAFLSSVLTAVLGIPGAYLVGRTKMHPFLRKILRLLSSVPFVLPGVTVALGFFLTFGRGGLFTRLIALFWNPPQILYTFWAVLLAHVFYNFPLFIRIVGEAWESIDSNVIESAKLDGCSKWNSFRFVELPMILPSILRAFTITFIYTFTSFSVVLLLGGIRFSTVEVSIYMYSRILFDFRAAAALMVFQLLFLAVLAYVANLPHAPPDASARPRYERFPRWGFIFVPVSLVVVFVPLVASGLSGFIDHFGRFSTLNFEMLFSGDIEYLVGSSLINIFTYTLWISISASLLATGVALLSGYLSSRGSKSQYVLLFPATMSSVTIAFSYVLIRIPVVLKLVLVHSLIVLPVVFGIIETGWRKIPQSLVESARVEGAGVFPLLMRVVFPLMARPVLAAFVYSFTISVGETSATLTLAEPPVMTFSAAIFRLMSSRNTEMATALNTIYFALVVALFMAVEITAKEDIGGT